MRSARIAKPKPHGDLLAVVVMCWGVWRFVVSFAGPNIQAILELDHLLRVRGSVPASRSSRLTLRNLFS